MRCNSGTSREDIKEVISQTELELEWKQLELIRERAEIANLLMDMKDDRDEPMFKKDWIKKNILKIDGKK